MERENLNCNKHDPVRYVIVDSLESTLIPALKNFSITYLKFKSTLANKSILRERETLVFHSGSYKVP